jgi:hypothetical protein
MTDKKKQKNGCCKETASKVDVIYEILSVHKLDLEQLEGKIEEMSSSVEKVKSRMGL